MATDPDLAALIQQAARNLESLERLVQAAGADPAPLEELRQRILRLKRAYKHETDAITRRVLTNALERRSGKDRRKPQGQLEPA